ncbi:MAG: M1 family metallopeptidase [Candidatus Micrarchaeia archaeon]
MGKNIPIEKSKKKKEFKYYPNDFAKLPVQVLHIDLEFDIYEKHAEVCSSMRMSALQDLSGISLDANNLQINEISCNKSKIDYKYEKKKNKLDITFSSKIKRGEEFILTSKTTCHPTNNILEGLYFDWTPKGAPQTIISQCQQWGFQRITPCFDDMCAKCTYTTKITADSRYTHIISNGDVKEKRKTVSPGRDQIIFDNSKTPMAPYLFFLGVGTYEQNELEFEYPDGSKFLLHLLVPPNSDKQAAKNALKILYDGILWIHIFSGANCTQNTPERKKLYSLCLQLAEKKETEKTLAKTTDLSSIRKEISLLAKSLPLGYKYTGQIYREIGMQNSNFGGMENVGNTTVVTNRIMPFAKMPDSVFEYLIGVKAHEFYHNINGSEVTGKSPFELWLNEAVTCHIEQKYLQFVAGEQYSRLGDVMRIIHPDGGTLDFDTGAMTMPIIPDGFNYPDDLISDVTYSKAPEFVRMVEQIMGGEKFCKALALYYSRFRHSNASSKDWIDAMTESSGIDFNQMANSWLKQTGYPIVKVEKSFSKNKLILTLTQSGFFKNSHWQFPFSATLVDEKGNDIAHQQIWMKNVQEKIIFENLPTHPAFISFCRGYCFYGKVEYEQTQDELYLQLLKDSDAINRYMAFCKLADIQKMRLLKTPKSEFDSRFIETFFSLLSDEKLCGQMGTALLAIPSSVEDKYKKHCYQELYELRQKLRLAIAKKYKKELLQIYNTYCKKSISAPFVQKKLYEIKMREVKNSALSMLASLDTPDIHKLILAQFEKPQAASDKYCAFALILDSSIKTKMEIVQKYEEESSKDLVEWEVFLSRIGSNDSDDAIELMKKIEKSKYFKIDQSNDQRMLIRFAYNKRISMQTEKGREYLMQIILTLAKINEYSTSHVLSIFSKINDFEPKYHEPLISMLIKLLDAVPSENAVVHNTIKRLIKGAPDAVKTYEKKNGKLNEKYL